MSVDPRFGRTLRVPRAPGVCTFELSILDCLKGMEKGIELGWYDWNTFDCRSYDFFEKVDNGDMAWIVPEKFLAFAGPCPTPVDTDGYPAFTPEVGGQRRASSGVGGNAAGRALDMLRDSGGGGRSPIARGASNPSGGGREAVGWSWPRLHAASAAFARIGTHRLWCSLQVTSSGLLSYPLEVPGEARLELAAPPGRFCSFREDWRTPLVVQLTGELLRLVVLPARGPRRGAVGAVIAHRSRGVASEAYRLTRHTSVAPHARGGRE